METRHITVTGHGSVKVTPDVTRLTINNIGVRNTYDDTFELADKNNKALKKCLEDLNIDPNELRTFHFDISKKTKSVKDKYDNWKELFVGFELDQQMKIDLGMDTQLLGKLMKEIGRHVPEVEIEIGYTVKDVHAVELRMLEKAVIDAKEKAEIMAKAANAELSEIVSINYSHHDIYIYEETRNIRSNDEAMCCCDSSLNITPDDLGASDDVTVVWGLK
ncbi:MAG: SIMPL domain-containing protein [Bacteroidales bacterium]|nr:SIMPL domain-containing protein [Bacteroidales bacterium]